MDEPSRTDPTIEVLQQELRAGLITGAQRPLSWEEKAYYEGLQLQLAGLLAQSTQLLWRQMVGRSAGVQPRSFV